MKRIFVLSLLLIYIFISVSPSYSKPARLDGVCVWVEHTVSTQQTAESWRSWSHVKLVPYPGLSPAYLVNDSFSGYLGDEPFYVVSTDLLSYNFSTHSWDLYAAPISSGYVYRIRPSELAILQANSTVAGNRPTNVESAGANWCDVSSCASKSGQVNYDLQNYSNPSSPPVGGNVCYDDCQQSAEILWTDCIGSSCIASVKYTATGQSCGVETSVDNLQTDPPKRCTDEINEKIQQCGGSLNVLSFDFETCTGECTPDSCADQWKTLVDKCGGVMAVSTWNAATCSGTCISDPLPDVKQPDSEAVPKNVTSETKTNSDGSSEVTKTIVYNVDGNTYAETTTITYDSSGNQTGSTTSTSTGSGGTGTGAGTGDTQYFPAIQNSGFSQPYNPGEFDIPARFTTFLNNVKSSGLFSFSNDFFNSLPGGGSPVYEIEAGQYGHHTIDLSDTLSTGLAVLKTILLVCFGFLSIRAVIMKR